MSQKVRGWIYVITNPAMPGLVKVGFSTKDPSLRAQELGNTGSPHPYQVNFDLIVFDPRTVEFKVHQALSAKREAKEWFRCDVAETIHVIRRIAQPHLLTTLENTTAPEQAAGKDWHFNCRTGILTQVSTGATYRPDEYRREGRPHPGFAVFRGTGAYVRSCHVLFDDAVPSPHPTSNRLRTTATFSGQCLKCACLFKVTLTRYDTGACCPQCRHLNALSESIRKTLRI